MKLSFALAAFLALGGASFAQAPVRPVEKPATVRLLFVDGSCSGTAVGPRLILSASHCFEGGALVSVNGQPVEVVGELVEDGNDHALVEVRKPGRYEGRDLSPPVFVQWATLGGPMYQGQEIHLFGNPGGLVDIFRRGYVMGEDKGWLLIDAVIFRGDSGAAIFDRSGRVVGVVSTMFSMGENFHGMGAKQIKFSREQLEGLGL